MKDLEINIAIADLHGYTEIQKPNDLIALGYAPLSIRDQGKVLIPDYILDLNAMHDAESVLREGQKFAYECYLREVVSGKFGFWYTPHGGEIFEVSHATARQRAEALLRSLEKWVDA